MSTIEPYTTYRTKCGGGRATYHPEWSTEKPWALYVHGTATTHTADIQGAIGYFRTKGMELEVKSNENPN